MEATKELYKEKALAPKLRFKGFDDKWRNQKLTDLAEINPSNKSLPDKFIYIDLESVVKGQLLKENEILKNGSPSRAQRYLKQNDILFQMVRPYQMNNLFFNKSGDYVASTGYAQIRTKENSKFIYQYLHLQNFVDKVIERCTGTSYPSINSSDLGNIKISIPTLPEQQKIASFLSAVDEKIQQLTRKKELLELYKKGVMQQLFSGKLRFKDEKGKAFPKWEEKRLDEVANFRRGSFPQPYGLAKWFDEINGLPFVQVYDVDDNMRLKPNTKTMISKLAADQSVFVKEGTLVITIQGSIGRIAKTQYDAYVDRTLLIFQSYKKPIDVDYFKYVVSLLFEIEKTKAPGGTIKTITKEALSSFKIMIPQIEEQKKIADYLSNIDNKIESVTKQITQTQTFKKGLLQQLFV